MEQRSGGGIAQLDSADDLSWQVEMPLYGAEPLRTGVLGSSTLVIDWPVLGYTYYSAGPGAGETSPLQPTWLFYGHTPDNLTQFVLRVLVAAADSFLDVTRVAP